MVFLEMVCPFYTSILRDIMAAKILSPAIKVVVAILILYTVFLPVASFPSIQGDDAFMMLVEQWSLVAGPLILVAFALEAVHLARPGW